MRSAPVEPFLQAWRAAVRESDASLLAPWIAEDVRFSSTAVFRPVQGRERVVALLADVLASISNYCVTKTWIDGDEVLLEFEASVGKRSVQGIDRITLDGEGLRAMHAKKTGAIIRASAVSGNARGASRSRGGMTGGLNCPNGFRKNIFFHPWTSRSARRGKGMGTTTAWWRWGSLSFDRKVLMRHCGVFAVIVGAGQRRRSDMISTNPP